MRCTRAIEAIVHGRDRAGAARGDRAARRAADRRASKSCATSSQQEYERDGRGFTLARVAGGYRYQTHPDAYPYVERFVLDGQTARLSGPALETLAIIAYKQPIVARAALGDPRRERRRDA